MSQSLGKKKAFVESTEHPILILFYTRCLNLTFSGTTQAVTQTKDIQVPTSTLCLRCLEPNLLHLIDIWCEDKNGLQWLKKFPSILSQRE